MRTRVGTLLLFGLVVFSFPGCASETSCAKSSVAARFNDAEIILDGFLDESSWTRVQAVTDFSYPWQEQAPPLTEFRSLITDQALYFSFVVEDDDLVIIDPLNSPAEITRGDRVEIFFSQDPDLNTYFCLEIDPRGRIFDYQASYYRQFDESWECPGLETSSRITESGYIVEGKIPLSSLLLLGIDFPDPDAEPSLFGFYRAEFSHGNSQEIIQKWISWIDPQTPTPDFHVPGSFGCLE